MIAPMSPPRPNGRTTDRITPARVDPSANAPSLSPSGVSEKISRQMDATIGTIMIPTTIPAMNADDVYTAVVTLNRGMKEKCTARNREKPMTFGCSS